MAANWKRKFCILPRYINGIRVQFESIEYNFYLPDPTWNYDGILTLRTLDRKHQERRRFVIGGDYPDRI